MSFTRDWWYQETLGASHSAEQPSEGKKKKPLPTISDFPQMSCCGSCPDYLFMDPVQNSLLATGF